MVYRVLIEPFGKKLSAPAGENLLSFLRQNGWSISAPCGGQGTCGKCTVTVNGSEVSACKTVIDRDMTVILPRESFRVLTDTAPTPLSVNPVQKGYLLAVDIGTTTIAGVLLDGSQGAELASFGISNPQSAYGADVISRIRHALAGHRQALTASVQAAVADVVQALCRKACIDPAQIGTVCIVGNPAMQQIYLGYGVENLAKIPFAPLLTEAKAIPAEPCLPACKNARLLVIPNVSGFVGADTIACVLASQMARNESLNLLVDIGTNGEIVLGNRERMVACATAAGPALEGANIRFGMGGREGAIDHIWLQEGALHCSVIGGGTARGICGSGLVDALAVALEKGWINERGKILTEDQKIHLCHSIYLDQEDVRQLQLAKGAIAAGIELLTAQLGVTLQDIDRVWLAGAFGTYMNAASACRMGLLPAPLQGKTVAMGNGALAGAKLLVCDQDQLEQAQDLTRKIQYVELSGLSDFPRCFAKNMRF